MKQQSRRLARGAGFFCAVDDKHHPALSPLAEESWRGGTGLGAETDLDGRKQPKAGGPPDLPPQGKDEEGCRLAPYPFFASMMISNERRRSTGS